VIRRQTNNTMSDKRGSTRIKDINRRQVVDAETRRKRQKRQLASLDRDNFQDDPHHAMNLYVAKAKLPSFTDNVDGSKKKRKVKLGDIFKHKAKRSFAALLEELQVENKDNSIPTYHTSVARPSKLPERHFCSVCGYLSKYVCVTCGMRYCSLECLKTHQDTRCMKWTA